MSSANGKYHRRNERQAPSATEHDVSSTIILYSAHTILAINDSQIGGLPCGTWWRKSMCLSMVQTVIIHDLIPVDARSRSRCERTETRGGFPRRLPIRCSAPVHAMIFRNVMHRGEVFILCLKQNARKDQGKDLV